MAIAYQRISEHITSKAPANEGPCLLANKKLKRLKGLNLMDYIAKHVADDGTEEQQYGNDHDGNQNEDQSILKQALSLLAQKK